MRASCANVTLASKNNQNQFVKRNRRIATPLCSLDIDLYGVGGFALDVQSRFDFTAPDEQARLPTFGLAVCAARHAKIVIYLKDVHKSGELFGVLRLVTALRSQVEVDRDSEVQTENEKRRQVARTP
jgi:hypothetical protein